MYPRYFILASTLFFYLTIYSSTNDDTESAIDAFRYKLNQLEQMVIEIQKTLEIKNNTDSNLSGPGIPATVIDHYIKTANCTTLNTQPADACSNASFCYNISSFVDQNATSLAGYTFTAVKGTADTNNNDSGVFLCNATNLGAAAAAACTRIGDNTHGATGSVQFTIPSVATNVYVYALANSGLLGAVASVSLTSIAVCKNNSPTASVITP